MKTRFIYEIVCIDAYGGTQLIAVFSSETKAKKALELYAKHHEWNRSTKIKVSEEWCVYFENTDYLNLYELPIWTDVEQFKKTFCGSVG